MKTLNLDILFTKYRLALPGFLAGAIGVILIIYSLSSVGKIFNTYSLIQETETKNQAIETQIARLSQLQSGELEEIESIVNSALPPEKPVFNSLTALTEIAGENNVTISNILSRPGSVATPSAKIVSSSPSRRAGQAPKSFDYIPITLEVVGPVEGTTTFMEQLLQINPLMELRTVRSSQGQRDSANFSSEIDLEVYWQAKQESKTAVSEASKVSDFTSDEVDVIEAIRSLRNF